MLRCAYNSHPPAETLRIKQCSVWCAYCTLTELAVLSPGATFCQLHRPVIVFFRSHNVPHVLRRRLKPDHLSHFCLRHVGYSLRRGFGRRRSLQLRAFEAITEQRQLSPLLVVTALQAVLREPMRKARVCFVPAVDARLRGWLFLRPE